MKTTQETNATTSTLEAHTASTAWAWWGVPSGLAGLIGNFVSTHGTLNNTDAEQAVDAVARTSYHVGTVLAVVSFACLLLVSAGWRAWGSERGLAQQAIPGALTVTATLVLFGAGLRGALAEYLPGGINADNFDTAGLYALFIVHDTAPWFAWWGVLMVAALVAFSSLASQAFPRWLGVLSIAALAMPVAVMAGSGAVAAAGFIGPIWLVAFSVVIAVRGTQSARV